MLSRHFIRRRRRREARQERVSPAWQGQDSGECLCREHTRVSALGLCSVFRGVTQRTWGWDWARQRLHTVPTTCHVPRRASLCENMLWTRCRAHSVTGIDVTSFQ